MAPEKFWKGELDMASCVTRVTMCCRDPSLKIVGVIGILLLLFGLAQIGIGVYFMLVLPAFAIASNIWTGSVTGLIGLIWMYIGLTSQAKRRSYIIITLSLITLLLNVLNLVIIQVGEKWKFLTEEALEILNHDSEKMVFFDIAIWSSTGLSSVVIFCTFLVSQYLFCRHLSTSKRSSRISYIQSLHCEKGKSAAGNRFFPPSRLVPSKVDAHQSAENGLWIPRNMALNTWNEDTLRHNGDGGGEGGGSLGLRNEVVLGFERRRTTVELKNGSSMDDRPGESKEPRDIDGRTAPSLNDSNRLSTFRPRPKKLSSQIPSTNENTEFKAENISNEGGKISSTDIQDDDDTIPAFLHNHPTSWMFLLPNVFTQVAGISSWDKFVEENVTSKPDERAIEGSDDFENPAENCSLAPVNYTSTEKLFIPSPKSRTKLKRPKETPPLPPDMNHIPVCKDGNGESKSS